MKSHCVGRRLGLFLNCACWWALWGAVGCSKPPPPAEPGDLCGGDPCPDGTVCQTRDRTERRVSNNVSRGYVVRRAECVMLPGRCRSALDCPGPQSRVKECSPGPEGVGFCVDPGVPESGYE
jgi:hypothetical protein